MNDVELARTLESRLEDLDLAKTIERSPRATIEPKRHASSNGVAALDELRRASGPLEGKIALLRTLGEGGMGIVHLASQATMGRHVAVKRLREGHGDVDATLRILREAWVTGALEHPNVVPVYDVGVDGQGAPVIVMKRIEGRPWCDVLKDGELAKKLFSATDALEENVRVLANVCNAVHFAHSRGILHRDLKPENVMIGAFGEVYVLDWGIAVSLRDDPSGRLPLAVHATEVAGTPSYMAPEMLLGDPTALSPRTDVYLLGACFYEIFAGAAPHAGPSLQAMIASILLSSPTFPPSFPAEARRICAKAMARDPEHRFESAEEFKVAIEDYLRHRGSRKLAFDAKQSLSALLETLKEPESEERTLAVFNLLGECRFGYRAALSAWPENEAARRGLDRALLAVVDHEIAVGDPHAASTLLREVAAPPSEVVRRVDEALKKRAEEDERMRKLAQDLDPSVGTRTRSAIGGFFGVLWTATPIGAFIHQLRGEKPTHEHLFLASAAFLVIGAAFRWWARESLTKTLLNRRLTMTLGWHLVLQMVLAAGCWLAGLSVAQSTTMLLLTWAMIQTMLAIWVEAWFASTAVLCALSFVVAAVRPQWLYPLMALDNLVFTAVLIRVWLPQQDRDLIKQRRELIKQRARKVFLEARVAMQAQHGIEVHREEE